MENLFITIFVSVVIVFIGYLIFQVFKKKKIVVPSPVNPIPPFNSDDYPKFDVIIDIEGSSIPCFSSKKRHVVYGQNPLFCENDRFNSTDNIFGVYPLNTILYLGHDEKYLTVITDGTNYATKYSNCVYCGTKTITHPE